MKRDPAHLGQDPPAEDDRRWPAAPSATTSRPGRARAMAPQPSWMAATSVKVIDRLAVLAVDADGGGVDGAGAEGRGPSDGEPAERAEGGDGMGRTELSRATSCSLSTAMATCGTPFFEGECTCPRSRRGSGRLLTAQSGHRDGSSGRADGDEHVAGDRAVHDVHEVVVVGRGHREAGAGQRASPGGAAASIRRFHASAAPPPGRSRSSHTGQGGLEQALGAAVEAVGLGRDPCCTP